MYSLFHNIKLLKIFISEILAKYGIRCAFTNRINRSIIFSFLADIFSKESFRGTALYSYLKLLNNERLLAQKRYEKLQKFSGKLINLSSELKLDKISSLSLVQKIYSLKKSWDKQIIIPRQMKIPLNNKEIHDNNILFNPYLKNENGLIVHLITNDHEWSITPGKSYGKPFLSIYEAEIQLVKKGRLINKIAADCGIPWTHLIDIGSYMLISKAAEYYPETWGYLVSEFHNFLIETILTGNDLGVHVHSDKSHLAAEKFEADRIWIKEKGVPTWGQLEGIGSKDDPDTKLGMVVAGKKLVEKYGQIVDPSFRACFFRAGKYATGRNYEETCNSMKAVKMAGLEVASDALLIDGITESLGRSASESVYRAKLDYPWLPIVNNNEDYIIQALPMRTKDFPVYSVVQYARAYSKNPKVLTRLIKAASSGNGFIISIDHVIEINNTTRGGKWDCLDQNRYDWLYLRNYLRSIKKSGIFKCVTSRDFFDEIKNMV